MLRCREKEQVRKTNIRKWNENLEYLCSVTQLHSDSSWICQRNINLPISSTYRRGLLPFLKYDIKERFPDFLYTDSKQPRKWAKEQILYMEETVNRLRMMSSKLGAICDKLRTTQAILCKMFNKLPVLKLKSKISKAKKGSKRKALKRKQKRACQGITNIFGRN